jgi:hypothetical protein
MIRKRLELNSRIGNTIENNSTINTSSSHMYNRHTFRPSNTNNSNLNSSRDILSTTAPHSIYRNYQNSQNSQTISVNEASSTSFHRRHLNNNNIFISVYKNKKNLNKKLGEIQGEQKKEETIKEEKEKDNLGSEIKDTVKCYICFDKITKPKMCPCCHRIACEKCLYNWFVNLNKKKCGFCRKSTNFAEMVSVPFMDVVVDFVDKFFNNKNSEEEKNNSDKEFSEYCPEHKNEILYYYCLDCGKAYCKTCFVFFGEEKDKHVGHSIIEYEKYKNMSFPLLKKNLDKLESNIQHVEENIKRCISYKNSYEHQRKVGNEFLNNLQDAFNNQMDVIISSIDNHIKKLNDYIKEYNKYKKDIDEFYSMIKNKKSNTHQDKSCESLIIKLTNINQHKFFSSKDIEKLSDLSKNLYVNTYQSKIGEFNHENIFLSKGLKMGTGPCELVIHNKQRDEVIISVNIPRNKFHGVHNFKGIIFIRKKGECMQSYDLDEYSEDYNFYYLKKKIPWDFFGSSIFKLKGILYDFYFS